MIIPSIVNLAEICAKKGVKNVILSPGSRCAALTIAFARHPEIDCKSVSDERAAAFIALGIAQKTKNPTAIVCTSGSATYNYAPAIAEAYFQNIPLLVLSADRPKEWIGQQDGQTIFQENIFGKHVKKSYNFPSDYTHEDSIWYANRISNEAINESMQHPKGPVHINIPIREPFYPEKHEKIEFQEQRIIEETKREALLPETDWRNLKDKLKHVTKILIIAGQGYKSDELKIWLTEFSEKFKIPILTDIISNLHEIKKSIKNHDAFLQSETNIEKQNLKPDLVISFGKSVISKQIKVFLREFKPKQHWHIQHSGEVADTFCSLTKVIRTNPENFFYEAKQKLHSIKINSKFRSTWNKIEKNTIENIKEFFNNVKEFGEFASVKNVLNKIPKNSDLHLANSMVVRYANYIGVEDEKNIEVFSNRGVSGIDGCTSTALGSALVTDKLTCLLTGDMAFFYDRNALWNNFIPPNLRIILINNHAGGIFRMIPGSSQQEELEEFFETKQVLYAKNTCKDFKLEYYFCDSSDTLEDSLNDFFQISNKAKLLEIRSDKFTNERIFKAFKSKIKNKHAVEVQLENH